MPGDVPRQPTSATTASSSPASTAPRSGATTPMPCARANDATRCDFDPSECTGSTQRTPASGTTELRPETWTRLMVAVMRLVGGPDLGILPGSVP